MGPGISGCKIRPEGDRNVSLKKCTLIDGMAKMFGSINLDCIPAVRISMIKVEGAFIGTFKLEPWN